MLTLKFLVTVVFVIIIFSWKVDNVKTQETSNEVTIERNIYNAGENFIIEGVQKSINCLTENMNQKLEWINPRGEAVKNVPTERIYTQEIFKQHARNRVPALTLIFSHVLAEDSGIWVCKSRDANDSVPVCVIDAAKIVDTPLEVIVDLGRSISLKCEARGNPEPKITWKRNDESITNESDPDKYVLTTKYNAQGFEELLTVKTLDEYDAGIYTCVASQENPIVDNCTASAEINITLYVQHPPSFDTETEIVFAKEDESVDLECQANGYPSPKYRWFRDFGDYMSEYTKNIKNLENDSTQAIISYLAVKANASTFGNRFRCKATNIHGEADKIFIIQKLERPTKPDELTIFNSTDTQLQINVTWLNTVMFPIEDIDIEVLEAANLKKKTLSTLSEVDWRTSAHFESEIDSTGSNDCSVVISELKPDTKYYLRARASNEMGKSLWSRPIEAATISSEEEETTPPVKTTYPGMPDTTLYGIVCGVVVIVMVAILICMKRLSGPKKSEKKY